jgi:hypothetical protein
MTAARVAGRDGGWDAVSARTGKALALWRGEPLAGVESETLAQRKVPRLAELRIEALQMHIDADLRLGRHAEVVVELQDLAAGMTRLSPATCTPSAPFGSSATGTTKPRHSPGLLTAITPWASRGRPGRPGRPGRRPWRFSMTWSTPTPTGSAPSSPAQTPRSPPARRAQPARTMSSYSVRSMFVALGVPARAATFRLPHCVPMWPGICSLCHA